MRILHVIPQFPYFGGRTIVGGHASALLTLALAQHAAGEHVAILSHTRGRSGAFRIEGGPKVYSLSAGTRAQTVRFALRFVVAAAAWLRQRRSEFDVVHVHSGHADYFVLSRLIRNASALPTLHTLYCPIRPSGRFRLPGMKHLIRACANALDWTGGISENVTRSMRDYGIPNAQCIRVALDTNRFRPLYSESPLRRSMGIRSDEVIILFVGNASAQKNLRCVLSAFHALRPDYPNARLVITTELKQSSPDHKIRDLDHMIVQLGLSEHVTRLGIVEDMPELMRASDILVAPFLDTFGPSDYFLAALEAMAVGKPVIVSNRGGMPELITSEVGTLVEPQDVTGLASALHGYCCDAARRRAVGANARSLIEDRFEPQRIVSSYHSVYERIVS